MKYLLIFTFILTVISCNKTKPVSPPPPVVPDAEMNGSFESKFSRYSKGQKYSGEVVTKWSDTAWKNDRIHRQIILWSKTKFSNLNYEVTDLKNESKIISSSNVRLRNCSYVYGDAVASTCGNASRNISEIADALSPTLENTLFPEDPIKLWVTIDVPSATVTGNYSGTIIIKAGTEIVKIFNISLLIVNKTLPNVNDWAFHLDLWQFPFQYTTLCKDALGNSILPFTNEYYNLIQPFYRLLADAGQKAITTYIKDGAFLPGQTMVKWTKNADASWSFDFTNFNSYVSKMMDWGITKQINAFSLIGWNTNTSYYDAATLTYKTIPLDIADAGFTPIWNSFLTAFKNNLDSKGWFEKTVLYMDEINDEKMPTLISLIRNHNPNWKIGLAGSYLRASTENSLYDYSTIWGYNRLSSNAVKTFYTSCSQAFPNNYVTNNTSPAEMPFMAWYAASKGLNGYLRWAFDYWTKTSVTNIGDGNNAAGDFNMIYRTDNTATSQPVSSIRLELLREGIQDFEKINILNSSGLNTVVALFSSSSGNNALQLVSEAQRKLKEISTQ